jgi:spore coat polysaccharide biosynthesis protein SpsF (cytidylyltransferase family)/ribosomal protein S18 acetylase RimI-like enzyme
MLALQLQRLSADPPAPVVVATTTDPRDDPVAELASTLGIPCVRGSEADVLDRYRQVLDVFPADTVVRLTGDCPLTDPALVAEALKAHETTGAAYVSNTLIRTYPDGLDVEVIDADALVRAADESRDAVEREHVTPYVYRRPERFSLRAVRTDELLGDERWTVDTAADLDFVRSVVAELGDVHFGWRDVLSVTGRRAPVPTGTLHLRPATEADASLLLAWRNDADAVRFSVTGASVSEAEHDAWFARYLVDPSGRIWIGEVDGAPVGQVRVDVRAAVGTVSIAVAPEERGHGYAVTILESLDGPLSADLQVTSLVAEVENGNTASLRAFARAGFSAVARRDTFAILRRDRGLAQPIRERLPSPRTTG